MQRSTGEIGIMRFLRRLSTIPVPEIYAVHSASEAEPFNFIVMQLMPGTTLLNGFGLLDTDAKVLNFCHRRPSLTSRSAL